MSVTPSGLGEFSYCNKKWALARKYGHLTRQAIEQKIAEMSQTGQTGGDEFSLYQRMLTAQARLDAGTAAHTSHARSAGAGRQAASTSWILAVAAVALAAVAIYLLAH